MFAKPSTLHFHILCAWSVRWDPYPWHFLHLCIKWWSEVIRMPAHRFIRPSIRLTVSFARSHILRFPAIYLECCFFSRLSPFLIVAFMMTLGGKWLQRMYNSFNFHYDDDLVCVWYPYEVDIFRRCCNKLTLQWLTWFLGAVSIRKTVLPGMAIPMLKIRRPNGRLIFNMEIAIRR